ncbi:Uncharacterized protein APZ42_011961 [Daphnia magna]|uniref:Uncharacterized protein n=1 Tax=Daphnia magna TaxID=35525 RepID=A0A162SCC0_9CRUS|nr:Uncharacterized protein APZ42_011961 [Daphnia magna]
MFLTYQESGCSQPVMFDWIPFKVLDQLQMLFRLKKKLTTGITPDILDVTTCAASSQLRSISL